MNKSFISKYGLYAMRHVFQFVHVDTRLNEVITSWHNLFFKKIVLNSKLSLYSMARVYKVWTRVEILLISIIEEWCRSSL